MLPLDYSRCYPETPDSHCRVCARWADQQGQTWGPRTPAHAVSNSADDGCLYIAACGQREAKCAA